MKKQIKFKYEKAIAVLLLRILSFSTKVGFTSKIFVKFKRTANAEIIAYYILIF